LKRRYGGKDHAPEPLRTGKVLRHLQQQPRDASPAPPDVYRHATQFAGSIVPPLKPHHTDYLLPCFNNPEVAAASVDIVAGNVGQVTLQGVLYVGFNLLLNAGGKLALTFNEQAANIACVLRPELPNGEQGRAATGAF
jgi:hypothetical protein